MCNLVKWKIVQKRVANKIFIIVRQQSVVGDKFISKLHLRLTIALRLIANRQLFEILAIMMFITIILMLIIIIIMTT